MFVLNANITIKSEKRWVFDKITSCHVERSFESLTDTAVLVLPKKVKWQGDPEIPIRRGDPVTVQLGYDGKLETVFMGYITSIGSDIPVDIKCEDEMFMLKQRKAIKKAYRTATIRQVLEDQGMPYTIRVMGEQSLGAYRVTATTVAELLADLGKSGIRSFFITENGSPVLCSGILFDRSDSPLQVFSTGVNLIERSSLKHVRSDEAKYKVKAVSIDRNNKRTTVEVGDEDGSLRTFVTCGKSEAELKAWADAKLSECKNSGLEGSFTTFGARVVDKLDHVGVKLDGVRCGIYQVKKNVIDYGIDGYRQIITLGRRSSK